MKNFKLLIALILVPVFSNAQSADLDTLKYCVVDHSVGVGGYDPVSYFNAVAPILGKKDITSAHEGVTYLFSSEKNKSMFEENPTDYLPQFGGWCSMTLAMGRATQPVYENYLVQDNKLYLFERTLSVNGQTVWKKNPKENEKRASSNYDQYKEKGVIQ